MSFLRKWRRTKLLSRSMSAWLSSKMKSTELQRCSTIPYLRRSKRNAKEVVTSVNTTSPAGTLWQPSSSKTSSTSSRPQILHHSNSRCYRGQQLYGNRLEQRHQAWLTSSSKLLLSAWTARSFWSQLGQRLRACRAAKMYKQWRLWQSKLADGPIMTVILPVSGLRMLLANPLIFSASKGTHGSHSLWETSQSNPSPLSRNQTTIIPEASKFCTAVVWQTWSIQTLEMRRALSISRNTTSSSAWPYAPWKTKRDLASLASASWRTQLLKYSNLDSHRHQEASSTRSTRQLPKAMTIISLKPGRHLSSWMAPEEICLNSKSTSSWLAGGLKVTLTSQASNCKTRQVRAQKSWVKKSILSRPKKWETTKWQASRSTRKTRSIWEASKSTSNKVNPLSSDLLMVYQSESSTSNQAITSLEWLLLAQVTLTEGPGSSDSRSGVAHSAPNTSSKLPLTVMTSRSSRSGLLSMNS